MSAELPEPLKSDPDAYVTILSEFLPADPIAYTVIPPGGIRWDFPAAPLEDDDAAEGL